MKEGYYEGKNIIKKQKTGFATLWTPDFCQERYQETQGGQSKGEAFVCGVRMQRGEPKKGGVKYLYKLLY